MLSRLHQQRSVVLLCRSSVGRQAGQQILKIGLGIGINLAQFFLEYFGTDIGVTADLTESSQQANGWDDFFFLQRNRSTRPVAANTSSIAASTTAART